MARSGGTSSIKTSLEAHRDVSDLEEKGESVVVDTDTGTDTHTTHTTLNTPHATHRPTHPPNFLCDFGQFDVGQLIWERGGPKKGSPRRSGCDLELVVCNCELATPVAENLYLGTCT